MLFFFPSDFIHQCQRAIYPSPHPYIFTAKKTETSANWWQRLKKSALKTN